MGFVVQPTCRIPNIPCKVNEHRHRHLPSQQLFAKEKAPTEEKKTKTFNEQQDESSSPIEELPSWVQAIRKWPRSSSRSSNEQKENDEPVMKGAADKDKNNIDNNKIVGGDEKSDKKDSMSNTGGWLMDPIMQSLISVQYLLGSSRNESEQMTTSTTSSSSAASSPATSRNFLDLLEDDSKRVPQNSNTTTSMSQMEAILDSLEDAAVVMNVSAANVPGVGVGGDLLGGLTGWNRWDQWVGGMQQALSRGGTQNLTAAAEGILRQATMRIENVLMDASIPAGSTLQAVLDILPANTTKLAAQVAAERGLDMNEAIEGAQQLGKFAGQLKGVADGLLRQGYVSNDDSRNQIEGGETLEQQPSKTAAATETNKPKKTTDKTRNGALFRDFASASELNEYTPVMGQAAEMGAMSGIIYEETVPRSLKLGHSIVAQGCSMNVKWMVTDSLASHSEVELCNDRLDNDPSETPVLIRTILIRGFDASDEEVDRDTLVRRVCTANPENLGKYNIDVHAGLWEIAQAVYKDVVNYIDWTTPQHKIVLAGHSIGGSIANLVLFKLTMKRGADFVEDRILRVYTYGSPPVAALSKPRRRKSSSKSSLHCEVLDNFGLPANLVWGFVQPWDPICRLFSEIDALYPLIGDMGPESDGITPWPTGPPRTLRPVTKAILEAWEGWPRFRDTFYETGSQNYTAVGIQHILLPEAARYLTERFLTVTIAVPPVRSILRISPSEIYPALTAAFPLDVFEISYVPQAIRGFVHHFFPAYYGPLVEYVRLLEDRKEPLLVRDNLASVPNWEKKEQELEAKTEEAAVNKWSLAWQANGYSKTSSKRAQE